MDFAFLDADDNEVHRCAWALLAEQDPREVAWWVIATWERWKSLGYLPFDGDLGDQPAWLTEAIGIVEREVRRRESEAAARDRDQLQRVIERSRDR